jgi:hypothetical protein
MYRGCPFAETGHQFTLAGDVVEEQQKHQFDEHDRIERGVAVAPVGAGDLGAPEGEIDEFLDLAQGMGGRTRWSRSTWKANSCFWGWWLAIMMRTQTAPLPSRSTQKVFRQHALTD